LNYQHPYGKNSEENFWHAHPCH